MSAATEINYQQNLDLSWSQILQCSKTLEQVADECAWENVASLAQQRHQLVVEHFSRFPVGPDTADFYMHHLNAFMNHEARLNTLIANAREQTVKDINQFTHQRKAVNAYQTGS
jgi:hypothetical protein